MKEDNRDSQGLNRLAEIIHSDAVNKGFWNERRELGTRLMLVVSELSEALEADREGRWYNGLPFNDEVPADVLPPELFLEKVKDTVEDELADALIRILGFCHFHTIDIDAHVNAKLAFNRTREHKYGKNY